MDSVLYMYVHVATELFFLVVSVKSDKKHNTYTSSNKKSQ